MRNDFLYVDSSTQDLRAPWAHRLIAVACFFGAAPIVWISPWRRRAPLIERHCSQALALFLALALILVINTLLFLLVSYLLVFNRTMYETQPVERIAVDIQGTLLLLWGVAWMIGAGKALLGSSRGIPYLTRLRDSHIAVRAGFAVTLVGYALILVIAGIATHASMLAQNDLRPARAYMLFDDLDWVPQWIFELGFYRIARSAASEWGPDASVVAPFTVDALDTALAHGSFVFLSSHGTDTGLYTRDRWFTPEDAAALTKGPRLQYVYITGCDSGAQARAWEEALAPARVVTFNRLSAVAEHVYWLWFQGPAVIRTLAANRVG